MSERRNVQHQNYDSLTFVDQVFLTAMVLNYKPKYLSYDPRPDPDLMKLTLAITLSEKFPGRNRDELVEFAMNILDNPSY